MSANSANTGKTESGGSDHIEDQKPKKFRNTGALDDMEDEEERFQEYKDKCDDKDDLTKDLALAQKTLGYRDRLYSSSGVIIEGPTVLKQKKKSSGQGKGHSSKFDE